ncbi:hypothetical protein MBLNU230_g1158t1 [Neophaeotheca triangularis]
MASYVSSATSALASWNPFTHRKEKKDPEDQGETIGADTVAGGGHGSRESEITKRGLRISHALQSFLVKEGLLPKGDADTTEITPRMHELLDKPHVQLPASVTDRSHALSEYYISSSHNTYLTAHQMWGESHVDAYTLALNTGSRCVEIDVWDDSENPDEPKVTHGWTLTSNVSFRSVCETIRDVVDREAAESQNVPGYQAAPIMVSLENHCDAHGQRRIATIMRETWGDRLLSKPVRDTGKAEEHGSDKHVTLEALGSKIAVQVEYHFPDEPESSDSEEEDEEEDAEAVKAHADYKEKKKAAASAVIVPELEELGVYAQSVKPRDKSWLEGELEGGPHHHLINVSESGLASLMPSWSQQISKHNANHLMRVYPKGTRIFSRNLNPVIFWAVGAQVCALNWQTFDASMQLNEALFAGSDGYVLKPAPLRKGGSGILDSGRKRKLRLHIAGASDVPLPDGRDPSDILPYVTCTLVHPDNLDDDPPKRKTEPYKQRKLGFLHRGENPPANDPVWNERLEWEYEENEMAFLRILLKSDDSWKRNPILAVTAVRLAFVAEGWCFIRMLDLRGAETHCSLLVKFEHLDV